MTQNHIWCLSFAATQLQAVCIHPQAGPPIQSACCRPAAHHVAQLEAAAACHHPWQGWRQHVLLLWLSWASSLFRDNLSGPDPSLPALLQPVHLRSRSQLNLNTRRILKPHGIQQQYKLGTCISSSHLLCPLQFAKMSLGLSVHPVPAASAAQWRLFFVCLTQFSCRLQP